jgi:hypothetical protein
MHRIICDVSTGKIAQIDLTLEEIAEVNSQAAAWSAATEYQRHRAAAYPPVTDYIDGIVKGDTAQVQAYIDACLAVKAKYPKPE